MHVNITSTFSVSNHTIKFLRCQNAVRVYKTPGDREKAQSQLHSGRRMIKMFTSTSMFAIMVVVGAMSSFCSGQNGMAPPRPSSCRDGSLICTKPNQICSDCASPCPAKCKKTPFTACITLCVTACTCRDKLILDENGQCVCPKACECFQHTIQLHFLIDNISLIYFRQMQ